MNIKKSFIKFNQIKNFKILYNYFIRNVETNNPKLQDTNL